MAKPIETQEFDPFARAIPGQSFADQPGLRPYEKPPQVSNPEELAKVLEQELLEPKTSKALADLADVGVSIETLADGMMQKCFVEGICSPDVAELVKPIVFMIIAQIADDHHVEDITLFNEQPENEGLTEEQKLGLKQQIAPHKFEKIIQSQQADNELQADYEKELDSNFDLLEGQETETPTQEGFIDMETPQDMEYEEQGEV